MKKCSRCNERKTSEEFVYQKSSRDKLSYYCKECIIEYKKSKKAVVSKIYSSQKSHSKRRGHSSPNYTLEELRKWVYSQDNWIEIYNNWVKSDYQTKLVPSVDRLKDHLPYSLDNIRLIIWEEHDSKGAEKRKKKIEQYSKDGVFIDSFSSVTEASEKTSTNKGNISSCLKNNAKTAGGFIWSYLNKD